MVTHTKQSQPVLSAREIKLLEVDGLQFKDLNKNGVLDPYEDWRLPIEERVADLLSQMTLAEKVGLMFHPPLGNKEDGALSEEPVFSGFGAGATESILERHIVHFNTWISASARLIAVWTNNVQAMAEQGRLGIPVTISSDPRNHYTHRAREGGFEISTGSFSLWPQPIGFGAIGDAGVVERFAQIVGQEYRAAGLHTALHPQADLATEPRWGRISGTFGEDAELAAKLTAAYVRGLQGESLNPESVTAMVKHFPGGGPQWDGRDAHNEWGQEQFYPGNNFDYHLIPFRAAIEAGMAAVMPYYGIPMNQTKENVGMGFNREIITDLLREKMGYDGVVCTDWGITTMMPWGVQRLSEIERYKKAIDAGVDQFGGGNNTKAVLELVNSEQLPESRIDESARRLLRNIFALGLFENPFVDAERTERIIGNAEFQAAADEAQRRSIILLQNRGVLPLAHGTKVYIQNIDPQVAGQYGQVVTHVEDADIAILRVNAPGEKGFGFFGTMMPMGNLGFHGEELKHLQAIIAAKPTIIDIYLDRPAILTRIAEAAGLVGTFGSSDAALLDVLFGKFAPTGKLPFELPSSMDAVEVQFEDVPYDSENPLFEFGFGLTY